MNQKNNLKKFEIKIIIGLGNPGPKFFNTRHNIGFEILDILNQEFNESSWQIKKNYEFSKIIINDKNIILIKPLTFMNLSGEILPELKKHKINPENILVIHDDLESKFGTIKFKNGGSANGHNGLKSIISFIGKDFLRCKFGIDRPENKAAVSNYVLSKFSKQENESLPEKINLAIEKIKFKIFN